jgi:hypothetical protein
MSDSRAGFFCVLRFSGVLGWNQHPGPDNVGFTCTLRYRGALFASGNHSGDLIFMVYMKTLETKLITWYCVPSTNHLLSG